MNIGLLTYDGLPNLIESDQKLIPLFAEHDIMASAVVWNNPKVDWSQFDSLIFRNTWDYYLQGVDFRAWLLRLQNLGVTTYNPLQVVLENMHKFYLRDLQHKGVEIIPTMFLTKAALFDTPHPSWDKFVIKPAISGASHLTNVYHKSQLAQLATDLHDEPQDSEWLMQPFLPQIQTSGEVSLLFFDKKYQFSIRKVPKSGDFRVQVQFGGQYEVYQPSADVVENAEKILSHYPDPLLYARVDGVLDGGQFLLMEVELIEPDLYFDFFPTARQRFVDAFVGLV